MPLLPLPRFRYRECRGLVHAIVVAHVVSCDAPRRVLLLPSSGGTSYITFPPMLIEMEFEACNSVKVEGQRLLRTNRNGGLLEGLAIGSRCRSKMLSVTLQRTRQRPTRQRRCRYLLHCQTTSSYTPSYSGSYSHIIHLVQITMRIISYSTGKGASCGM